MRSPPPSDRILGVVVVLLALAVVFAWVPLDTETGLVERIRRRVSIGDALMPTVAGAFLILGGLMTACAGGAGDHRVEFSNMRHLAGLLALLASAFLVMRWFGPALAWILTEEGYRPLRDTIPWKYAGFLLGGTTLVAGLTAMVEGRVTRRAVLAGASACVVLIAVYDLPFDDLLLPPNGDV